MRARGSVMCIARGALVAGLNANPVGSDSENGRADSIISSFSAVSYFCGCGGLDLGFCTNGRPINHQIVMPPFR